MDTLQSSLHPDHLEDLKKSRLSDETIREAKNYSVPPRDINKKLGRNYPDIESLMAFPYPGCNGFERYKLFPPVPGKDGHLIRYYQSNGSLNHLYIPERVRPVLSKSSVPLYLTEGEKKTLKAFQEGLYCIALGGLWNWCNKDENGEKHLIPDFDKIEWRGRTTYLIPDNDWLNPDRHGEPKNLRQAVYELAYRLIDRGAKVFIVELPQGELKGLDDFLCKHTVEEFQALPKREIRKLTIEEMIQGATLETLPEILKRLAALKDTEQAVHVAALALRFNVPKSAIQRDIKKLVSREAEAVDIDELLEGGADPKSNHSAQNFNDGILSFGAMLGDQRVLAKSNGEIHIADGDGFRFKRSTLTAEAIKRFRDGDDVNGLELIGRIKTLFSDHIIFKDDRTPLLLATWTLGTYLFKMFRFYGYLLFTSPVKRCGKSLVLDIIALLAFNSTPRMVNPSESSTFREVHDNDATLIIDEVESLSDADREKKTEMISLLNAGFQRGAVVSRVETKNKEFMVCYFSAYCPKALAGIKGVADTVEDRSFKIIMARKAKKETVKRFNVRALESHIQKIRDDLFIWSLKYGPNVATVYDGMTEFPGTEALDDRLKDILESLLAIASVIDAQADDDTIQTVKTLVNLSKDMAGLRESQEDLNGSIPAAVTAMKSMVDGVDEKFVSVDELYSHLKTEDDLGFLESKRGMAFFLAKLDIHRTRRKVEGKTVRGYLLRKAILDDLGGRYS